jgi:HSP20 family protein
MTTRENAGTSAEGGRQQQEGSAGGRTSANTEAGAEQRERTTGAQGKSVGARGGRTQGGRSDEQERQLQMGREGAPRGRSPAREQRSLLPALFAGPPDLLATAFMSNPFGFMRRMSEEMNEIFEGSGLGGGVAPSRVGDRSLVSRSGQGATELWMPQIEVRQRGNEIVLRADLPGLKKEDVDIEVEDGVLTLSGERRQEQDDEQQGFYRSERSYGAFRRAVALPEGVNEEEISASFNDGVLEIRMPVPQERQQRGRRVQIK